MEIFRVYHILIRSDDKQCGGRHRWNFKVEKLALVLCPFADKQNISFLQQVTVQFWNKIHLQGTLFRCRVLQIGCLQIEDGTCWRRSQIQSRQYFSYIFQLSHENLIFSAAKILFIFNKYYFFSKKNKKFYIDGVKYIK